MLILFQLCKVIIVCVQVGLIVGAVYSVIKPKAFLVIYVMMLPVAAAFSAGCSCILAVLDRKLASRLTSSERYRSRIASSAGIAPAIVFLFLLVTAFILSFFSFER